MVLPVLAIGHPILKKEAEFISADYPDIQKFVADMFDTMYFSAGVGLAAPQVGRSIRLFVIDTEPFKDDYPDSSGFKQVFINAEMLEEKGDLWYFNEGCLSVPTLREDVCRRPNIKIKYFDENFVEHITEFSGVTARVIQHEYDHIEGKLFVDRLSPLKKSLIKRRLSEISKGKVSVNYKMKFNNKK